MRDPRRLGVAVREIRRWQGMELCRLFAADEAMAVGFHPFEPGNELRWTDGDAALPPIDGTTIVELSIGDTLAYPLAEQRLATPVPVPVAAGAGLAA